jgi:hypothetical protein
VIFKIITKILTIRISQIIHKYLEFTQTTFIPGRNIHDGVVVLHEILHDLKRTNGSTLIIKLDFEKSYDKVHWNFLEEVLVRKWFCHTWIYCIKQVM